MSDKMKRRHLWIDDELYAELVAVSDDESAALDNMPDSIRDSAAGEAMEAALELMAEAADELAHTLDNIREAAG